MSEHEKGLRDRLSMLREAYPIIVGSALTELDALLADQCVTGLEDAMDVLKKRQTELDRQRVVAKGRSNAEIADMKTEAATCSKAIHILRAEAGRRKKGRKG